MKARIVDLRYHMKDVLKAVDRGETVTVLYRGKERARLVPIRPEEQEDMRESPAFGMWKDRREMRDPGAWVRKLREGRRLDLTPMC
jgi:prevent-host-death family protein